MNRKLASVPLLRTDDSFPPSPIEAHSASLAEPVVAKVVSDPNPSKPLTHSHIDKILRNELKDAEFSNIPGLIDHIFPDSALPNGLSPQQILKHIENTTLKNGKQLYKDGTWNLPLFTRDRFSSPKQEAGCAKLFNSIVALAASAGDAVQITRIWSSSYSNRGLPGSRATRQPDIVLLDNSHDTPLLPQTVLQSAISTTKTRKPVMPVGAFQTLGATCQVKSTSQRSSKAREELAQDAYFIFSSQDNRRYVLGISFCGVDIGLSLFDRAGALHSLSFDIDNHPLQFIRLIVGLSYCSDTLLGYDPTITTRAGCRYIRLNGADYQILSTEFIADMVRGRGTICYRAIRDEKEYAIKDLWADTGRSHQEVEFLQAAEENNIPGVPICCNSAVIRIDSQDRNDLTSWARECIQPTHKRYEDVKKVEVREHRRLVMQPFALPLMQFASKIELLSVLRDVIRSTCTRCFPVFLC
jgi:hypothetical protein